MVSPALATRVYLGITALVFLTPELCLDLGWSACQRQGRRLFVFTASRAPSLPCHLQLIHYPTKLACGAAEMDRLCATSAKCWPGGGGRRQL